MVSVVGVVTRCGAPASAEGGEGVGKSSATVVVWVMSDVCGTLHWTICELGGMLSVEVSCVSASDFVYVGSICEVEASTTPVVCV